MRDLSVPIRTNSLKLSKFCLNSAKNHKKMKKIRRIRRNTALTKRQEKDLKAPPPHAEEPSPPTNIPKQCWKFSDFSKWKVVGEGKFGKVKSAIDKNSGCRVAIKQLVKKNMIADKSWLQVRREIEIQSRLRHPCIVRVFGYFQDVETLYIVMEYGGPSTLYDFVKRQNSIRIKRIKKVGLVRLMSVVPMDGVIGVLRCRLYLNF